MFQKMAKTVEQKIYRKTIKKVKKSDVWKIY